MEQRSLLASAMGVELGLASVRWAKPAHAAEGGCGSDGGTAEVDAESRRLVDGCDNDVSFDEFHHLHSTATSAGRRSLVHLKHADLSKHIQNLSSASRAIHLSGHTEPYLQSLAKALSHYYKTRLLLVNVTDFSLQSRANMGAPARPWFRTSAYPRQRLGGCLISLDLFALFSKKDEPRGTRPL